MTVTNGQDNWQRRCEKRKQLQQDAIPPEWLIEHPPATKLNVIDVPSTCNLLNKAELEITETSVSDLLDNLAKGIWSSVSVTTAFYKRAIIAHQLTNCLTEIFVERALQRAKELDDHLSQFGVPAGPLHGLPISLKDQFPMHGLETIMGYVGWIGELSTENCVLVELLYKTGANPFVRTNVPQTLIWGETYNHVFGRTVNPFNRLCTPGGSSGGEGALLALKGSPLGIGTDIGGSIRIPSSFCGLYGLRPSYDRFPYYGARNSADGQDSIRSVLGPMSKSIHGIKIFTEAILSTEPWKNDPSCIRMPWREHLYRLCDHGDGEKMCFAIMWDNGIVHPHPPIQQALKRVRNALEKQGHKVIDWRNFLHDELFNIAEYIFAADGGEDYQRACDLSGEPLIQLDAFSTEETRQWYMMTRQPLNKLVTASFGAQSAYQLWQLHEQKRQLRKAFLDHWIATIELTGTGRPVDAVISPTMPYAMTPHGLNTDAFYTTLWNILDYPSMCFPVTAAAPDDDVVTISRTRFYNHEDEAIHHLYHQHPSPGAPVGLQLTALPHEEEAVIAITEIVAGALKNSESGGVLENETRGLNSGTNTNTVQ